MRWSLALLVSLAAVLVFILPAHASYDISQSVIGSGGGEASGPNYSILGTVGQPAIGVVSGPSNVNEIGFWYLPGWILTDVPEGGLLPTVFSLGQNFPNPFNPVTTLRFSVPERSRVTVILYDVAGREVRTLADDEFEPGFHALVLDGAGLPSGVYFCRMASPDFMETRKLVLLK